MDGIPFVYTKEDGQKPEGAAVLEFKTDSMAEDDEWFHFEGMASTFGNVDHDGDIITQGAFTATLQRLEAKRDPSTGRLMPCLFMHDPGKPIGIFTELTETADGLFAKAKLPMRSRIVSEEVVPQINAGSLRALSIGFQILNRRWEGEIRLIEEVDLWEASVVTFGANQLAQMTNIGNKNKGELKIIRKLSRDDLEDLSSRDLETSLQNGCSMSRQLAKKVSSLLAADQRDAGEPQQAPRDADATDTDELSFWADQAERLALATKGLAPCRTPTSRP